jgi:hypothetical protein
VEVESLDVDTPTEGIAGIQSFDRKGSYSSLAELNEEWEDAPEEPKEYWYIDYDGEILCGEFDNSSTEKMMISMGNHFESIEEAKKAVEKLKAWKRLKDKRIRFDLDFVTNTISFTYRIDSTLNCVVSEERIIFEDMKTIFGGEE